MVTGLQRWPLKNYASWYLCFHEIPKHIEFELAWVYVYPISYGRMESLLICTCLVFRKTGNVQFPPSWKADFREYCHIRTLATLPEILHGGTTQKDCMERRYVLMARWWRQVQPSQRLSQVSLWIWQLCENSQVRSAELTDPWQLRMRRGNKCGWWWLFEAFKIWGILLHSNW